MSVYLHACCAGNGTHVRCRYQSASRIQALVRGFLQRQRTGPSVQAVIARVRTAKAALVMQTVRPCGDNRWDMHADGEAWWRKRVAHACRRGGLVAQTGGTCMQTGRLGGANGWDMHADGEAWWRKRVGHACRRGGLVAQTGGTCMQTGRPGGAGGEAYACSQYKLPVQKCGVAGNGACSGTTLRWTGMEWMHSRDTIGGQMQSHACARTRVHPDCSCAL